MYTRKEMFETDYISEILAQADGFAWDAEKSVDDFKEDISRLIAKIKGVAVVPDFIYVLTPYVDDAEKLVKATFTIKLRKKQRLNDDNSMKFSTVILCTSSVYTQTARIIANWVDNVFIAFRAVGNVSELNNFFSEHIPNSKVDFAFSKNRIVAVSDDKITIGLDDAQCADIADLPFFDSFELRCENATNTMVDIMDTVVRPLDFLRMKNFFTNTLELHTRVGFVKLIKKAYSLDIFKVSEDKEGIFRYETDKYFGLVARTSEDVPDTVKDYVIGEKFNYYWVLSPIDKKTEETVFDEDIKSELLDAVTE